MYSKIYIISILFVPFFIVPVYTQNFVPNCSFEEFTFCPSIHGEIDKCEGWYSPGEGTSDYCNECGNIGVKVPLNNWGVQDASEGVAYAHIIPYYPRAHKWEYIQTKLACSLIQGETYNVSFKVSCSDASLYAIDAIGLHFSADTLHQTSANIISLPGGPHISANIILDDKYNWMEVSGQYTANGDEEYITIGNFTDNANVNVHIFSNNSQENGSYYIDEVSVSPATPLLNLGNDTVLCPGETITIDATTPCATSYHWNTGLNSPVVVVNTPGVYEVEVEIGCGYVYDEVNVQYFQSSDIPLPNDTLICADADILLDAGSGFGSYLWQDGSFGQSFFVEDSGLFWVEVEEVTGCFTRDTVNIGSIAVPDFELGNDTTLCLGSTTNLFANTAGPYMEYLWSDYSIGQELIVSDSGIYWLTVSNPCGIVTDSIDIHYRNCNADIFMANAFTPNGDGQNDVFVAKGINIAQFRMYIFDRWGKKLFESTSMSIGWDGYFNGSLCPTGTYVWVVQYSGQAGISEQINETHRGTVTLLR